MHGQDLQLEFRQWVERQVSSNKLAFTARAHGPASSQPLSALEQDAAEADVESNGKESLVR